MSLNSHRVFSSLVKVSRTICVLARGQYLDTFGFFLRSIIDAFLDSANTFFFPLINCSRYKFYSVLNEKLHKALHTYASSGDNYFRVMGVIACYLDEGPKGLSLIHI